MTATGGMQVLPHCTFANCPQLDIVVAPGGILFFTGDEETMGRGATLGSTEWRNLTDAELGEVIAGTKPGRENRSGCRRNRPGKGKLNRHGQSSDPMLHWLLACQGLGLRLIPRTQTTVPKPAS